jgi:hypothetical protein
MYKGGGVHPTGRTVTRDVGRCPLLLHLLVIVEATVVIPFIFIHMMFYYTVPYEWLKKGYCLILRYIFSYFSLTLNWSF